MNKKLLRIFLVLLLLFVTVIATLLVQGHFRYEREIEAKPLSVAISEYTSQDGYVKFEDIDEDFVNAVISVEDKRFFSRQGYDFVALFRALYHNFKARDVIEGGSTITEQIAKNLYLGGSVNGLEEKMAEIFIMMALEREYSKEELFALYANMNYYGDGYWGIKDASEGYYGLEPDDLSVAKAAMLAGVPNAPAVYQLSDGYDLAKQRQEWVLSTMYNNSYIDEKQLEQAKTEDVRPIDR